MSTESSKKLYALIVLNEGGEVQSYENLCIAENTPLPLQTNPEAAWYIVQGLDSEGMKRMTRLLDHLNNAFLRADLLNAINDLRDVDLRLPE